MLERRSDEVGEGDVNCSLVRVPFKTSPAVSVQTWKTCSRFHFTLGTLGNDVQATLLLKLCINVLRSITNESRQTEEAVLRMCSPMIIHTSKNNGHFSPDGISLGDMILFVLGLPPARFILFILQSDIRRKSFALQGSRSLIHNKTPAAEAPWHSNIGIWMLCLIKLSLILG